MNLLFRVLFASGCRSTHHKLAMDALRHLRGPQATRWQNLFLKHHARYLEGAKAPDTTFRDFRNHVLHVRENYWGGAIKSARKWYDQTVEDLRSQKWQEAVYAAGVLSHYYTDPIQPFHTGQSPAESNIHRAAEWSITKSYDRIRRVLNRQVGMPEFECPEGDDWLEQMVVAGADRANPYYEELIEHYDFKEGVKNPPEGLDAESRHILAQLIGHAQVGFARILERAFQEAEVTPPAVNLTVESFLASVTIPIRWITKKMEDSQERKLVEAMYAELQETGRVEKTLPEDDRVVRELHQTEVLARQTGPPAERSAIVPIRPVVSVTTEPESDAKSERSEVAQRDLRFHLEIGDRVEDAPSIGPKTAKRLEAVGIYTVSDLLAADPAGTSAKLAVRYITTDLVQDWQAQAKLACQIPEIRGHDAQLLVGCGWRSPEQIADLDPDELLKQIEPFANSSEGKRIIRSGKVPDLAEVTDWIRWAGQSRSLRAA